MEETNTPEEELVESFLAGYPVRDEKRIRLLNRQLEEKERKEEKERQEKALKATGATPSHPLSPSATQDGPPGVGPTPTSCKHPAPPEGPPPNAIISPTDVESGPQPENNVKANAHAHAPPSPAPSSVGGPGFVRVLVSDPRVDVAGCENPLDTQNLLSDTIERDQTNLLDTADRKAPSSLNTDSPATANTTAGSPNQPMQKLQDDASDEESDPPDTPTGQQRKQQKVLQKKKEKRKRQLFRKQQDKLVDVTGKGSPKKKQSLHIN